MYLSSQRGRDVLSPVHSLTSPATPSSVDECYPVNPVRPARPGRPCQPILTLPFLILAARPLGAGPSRFSTPPALDLTDVGQVCSRKIRLSPYRCSELDPAEPSYVGPPVPEPRLPVRGSFSLIPQGSYVAPSSGPLLLPLPRPHPFEVHAGCPIVAPLTNFQTPDISASGL